MLSPAFPACNPYLWSEFAFLRKTHHLEISLFLNLRLIVLIYTYMLPLIFSMLFPHDWGGCRHPEKFNGLLNGYKTNDKAKTKTQLAWHVGHLTAGCIWAVRSCGTLVFRCHRGEKVGLGMSVYWFAMWVLSRNGTICKRPREEA